MNKHQIAQFPLVQVENVSAQEYERIVEWNRVKVSSWYDKLPFMKMQGH